MAWFMAWLVLAPPHQSPTRVAGRKIASRTLAPSDKRHGHVRSLSVGRDHQTDFEDRHNLACLDPSCDGGSSCRLQTRVASLCTVCPFRSVLLLQNTLVIRLPVWRMQALPGQGSTQEVRSHVAQRFETVAARRGWSVRHQRMV
jgi:hypothetical protein